MSLDRWDPFREMMTLRDAMDRLLQQSFVHPSQLIGAVRNEFPIDLIDEGNTFLVRASLPGVKPEDLEITVQGDQLTIRAEMRSEQEQSGSGRQWLMREHRAGVWQRTIGLPTVVNSDAGEARLEQGVLLLRLPKLQEAMPRRIAIGMGGGSMSGGSMSGQTSGGVVGSGAGMAAVDQPGSQVSVRNPHDGHPLGSDHTAGGDRVTSESQESFPASDPPSWTPEKV